MDRDSGPGSTTLEHYFLVKLMILILVWFYPLRCRNALEFRVSTLILGYRFGKQVLQVG